MTSKILAAVSIGALLLTACTKAREAEPAAPAVATAPTASSPGADASASGGVNRWLGRWQGPEGTFLEISGAPGAYRVTVQNLDGPRSFDASATSASGLSFVRDGVTETLRASDGAGTGMKWLADKKDCLVVKAGEGYCRG